MNPNTRQAPLAAEPTGSVEPGDGQARCAAVTHERRKKRTVLAQIGMFLSIGVIAVAATAAMNLASLKPPPMQLPTAMAEVAPVPGSATVSGQPAPNTQNTPDASLGSASAAVAPIVGVDPAWAEKVSAATGIPRRALTAYAAADLTVDAEQPGCGIGWNTLAAIGEIESGHGGHGGAVLSDTGYPTPAIRGIALDGSGVAAITDTDGGAWDGDTVWDRAVGPMQFIPETWARWGADGNGDGAADPNQIDDAALATARYLCHGGDMTSTETWRAGVFSYNHVDSYVNNVAVVANQYAQQSAGAQ
ncbi:Transglycosylase SLT domain-containing protein [Cryobacterium flavum]|uniref:Transglycosylase SLT domain-containing protein n=2 Tax=Cryobacterium flavum TaxID=1424659 RepID=A0A5E9G4F8_9MICO|nr:lytic murein transglycosylase [Cryobacterium flavum]SDO50089.1 Transglycosylase SLT domain-containing protein [Cryobacterium flavum]